jgi:hypothetical protein
MSKFTFICEEDAMPFMEGTVSKKTVEFNAVRIDDLITEFEMFLRGAGFSFDGHLDFVKDE